MDRNLEKRNSDLVEAAINKLSRDQIRRGDEIDNSLMEAATTQGSRVKTGKKITVRPYWSKSYETDETEFRTKYQMVSDSTRMNFIGRYENELLYIRIIIESGYNALSHFFFNLNFPIYQPMISILSVHFI